MSEIGAWHSPQIPAASPQALTLAKTAGISQFLAQLMLNRGITKREDVADFLRETLSLDWPRPPFEAELVALFRTLHRSQDLIVIHGDYDADGLTGTAILTEFLRSSGFRVEPFLPTRSLGYGLNLTTLERFVQAGAKLLITVDCGVSNTAEIAFVQNQGMQVIVTDHHGLGASLPPDAFILHPEVLKIPELQHLSGVGMAYWLTVLLHPHFDCPRPVTHWLELVGIGTIADMTPLRGFNRQLVKAALKQIKQTQRPGLLALLKQKQTPPAELDETTLAFRVIPLLNAAGRLQSPVLSLDLLLAEDPNQAETLAENLNRVNQARREMGQALLAEITARLDADLPDGPVILAEPGWPFGILGIICSQLVERYGRPVILMAIEGEVAKASVRAPDGFHVLTALQSCHELFLKYGGHAQAGGFSLPLERLPALKQRLGDYYREQGSPQLRPHAEMVLAPEQIQADLWADLQRLAPFGSGNPQPSFVSFNVPLQKVMPDRKGLHFFAEFSNGLKLKGWNMWQPEWAEYRNFDLHFELQQNTWKGRTTLELQLKQIRPHSAETKAPEPASTVSSSLSPLNPGRSETQSEWGFYHPHSRRYYGLLPLAAPWSITQATWLDGRIQSDPALETVADTWVLTPAPDFLGNDLHFNVESPLFCRQVLIRALPAQAAALAQALQCLQPQILVFQPQLHNLQPPPTFSELLQALAVLKKNPEPPYESLLRAALGLSFSRARLLLNCLNELYGQDFLFSGVFQAGYGPKEAPLDLRKSPAFMAYLQRYEKLKKQHASWHQRSFLAVKSAFLPEGQKCVPAPMSVQGKGQF